MRKVSEMAGKVWLVGAGPGDPGLLTLRGKEALEAADAVVFDRLAGDGILSFIPENAERIDVGKEGGHHPVPQREIEEILVREARAGKKVVRLKGGDPFVFGRGGEEIEALNKAGIPYEVVPGVTSAIAAPSAAGIPVTHRGLSASLHIITAHTKEGGIADLDYDALARLGGTLVFLMGASSVPSICKALLERGVSPETPAAAVENGTTARQRLIECRLADFEKKCSDEGLHSPAVIVVGEVAALGSQFAWKRFLPLSGMKILVTRPRARAGRLSAMLKDEGAEVVEFPCIATETIKSDIPYLGGFSWIGFTSVTGVESFFELMRDAQRDIREVGKAKFAAIGKSTADALESCGLIVSYMPDVYDGASLAEGLSGLVKKGEKLLMLRAKEGSRELTERLERSGVDFTETAVYETKYENGGFVPTDIDAALFTSASTVRGFVASCPDLKPKYACCIGRQTAEEARRLGFANIRAAEKATLESLIKTVEDIKR